MLAGLHHVVSLPNIWPIVNEAIDWVTVYGGVDLFLINGKYRVFVVHSHPKANTLPHIRRLRPSYTIHGKEAEHDKEGVSLRVTRTLQDQVS